VRSGQSSNVTYDKVKEQIYQVSGTTEESVLMKLHLKLTSALEVSGVRMTSG
jgi:hypothetical protein